MKNLDLKVVQLAWQAISREEVGQKKQEEKKRKEKQQLTNRLKKRTGLEPSAADFCRGFDWWESRS